MYSRPILLLPSEESDAFRLLQYFHDVLSDDLEFLVIILYNVQEAPSVPSEGL